MKRLTVPTELILIWSKRREGARFWLALLVLAFGLASVHPYPSLPSYDALNQIGNLPYIVFCLLAALLLLGPPAVRLFGAALALLVFLSVALLFTLSTQSFSTGFFIYTALALLALDVTIGGAK